MNEKKFKEEMCGTISLLSGTMAFVIVGFIYSYAELGEFLGWLVIITIFSTGAFIGLVVSWTTLTLWEKLAPRSYQKTKKTVPEKINAFIETICD